MMTTTRPFLQVGRSALLLVSTALNFFALRYLQLDEALAILFSTPFLVAVLMRSVARRMGRLAAVDRNRRRFLWRACWWCARALAGIHPAALLSFGSAICYALYVISTRVLARSDSSETTLFYSNLVGAVAMLPIIPFVWTPPQQRSWSWR